MSRSLVPRSLPVFGLALFALKANGHFPAEPRAKPLDNFHVVPTLRFAVSIVWTAARIWTLGCAAFGGVRGWHGVPAPLDR